MVAAVLEPWRDKKRSFRPYTAQDFAGAYLRYLLSSPRKQTVEDQVKIAYMWKAAMEAK